MNFCSHQNLFWNAFAFQQTTRPNRSYLSCFICIATQASGSFLPDKNFFFFIFFIFVIFDYLNITKHLSKKSNFCLQEETQFQNGSDWLTLERQTSAVSSVSTFFKKKYLCRLLRNHIFTKKKEIFLRTKQNNNNIFVKELQTISLTLKMYI